ncbi:MAG: flagellar assembly protein FliW [Candidatus Melainabacteria bacterium]
MTSAVRTITTSRFGDVEVQEDRIIRFQEPLLGFEDLDTFVLLDHAADSPFKWLQSAQNPDLAFVVTNPRFFGIEYAFTLPDNVSERLGIHSPEEVLVLTIVNIPQGNPEQMTANLMGPLIIHEKTLQAMQVVLNDTGFSTKTRLLDDSIGSASGATAVAEQER